MNPILPKQPAQGPSDRNTKQDAKAEKNNPLSGTHYGFTSPDTQDETIVSQEHESKAELLSSSPQSAEIEELSEENFDDFLLEVISNIKTNKFFTDEDCKLLSHSALYYNANLEETLEYISGCISWIEENKKIVKYSNRLLDRLNEIHNFLMSCELNKSNQPQSDNRNTTPIEANPTLSSSSSLAVPINTTTTKTINQENTPSISIKNTKLNPLITKALAAAKMKMSAPVNKKVVTKYKAVFVKKGNENYTLEDAKILTNNMFTWSHTANNKRSLPANKPLHTEYINSDQGDKHVLEFLQTHKNKIENLKEGYYEMYFEGQKLFDCIEYAKDEKEIQTPWMHIKIQISHPISKLEKQGSTLTIEHHFPINRNRISNYLKQHPANEFFTSSQTHHKESL